MFRNVHHVTHSHMIEPLRFWQAILGNVFKYSNSTTVYCVEPQLFVKTEAHWHMPLYIIISLCVNEIKEKMNVLICPFCIHLWERWLICVMKRKMTIICVCLNVRHEYMHVHVHLLLTLALAAFIWVNLKKARFILNK